MTPYGVLTIAGQFGLFALALLSVIILPATNESGGTGLSATSYGMGGLFGAS